MFSDVKEGRGRKGKDKAGTIFLSFYIYVFLCFFAFAFAFICIDNFVQNYCGGGAFGAYFACSSVTDLSRILGFPICIFIFIYSFCMHAAF